MKKGILGNLKLIIILLISITGLQAQNFTEMETTIVGTGSSSLGYSDVDNDGDLDVLISGIDVFNVISARLYLNDGAGNYSEVAGTPFMGTSVGDLAFSDVDGDGDEDVIITGMNNNWDDITKLYLNDGSGEFTEDENVPFLNLSGSALGFSDIDNDGDNDVLITGLLGDPFALTATLYTNDGNGVFSEVSGTPFIGSWDGSVKFIDTDNDGDEDVLLTGRDPVDFLPVEAILYSNDNGTFNQVMGTSFKGAMFSSIAFADIDGDSDYDILISGQNIDFDAETSLYINDGGTFTEDTSHPLKDVDFCENAFSDVDNDGDQDVLINGAGGFGFDPVTILYENDGSGVFTELSGEPFVQRGNGAAAFFDADGDNVDDVLITGDPYPLGGPLTTNLYINNNESVSVSDIFLGNTSIVYPNPASNRVTIKAGSPIEHIHIYNKVGQLVKQINSDNNIINMDLSGFDSGIYFVKIFSSNQVITRKLVIE